MDDEVIGVLTYIDNEEHDSRDCQFVFGITEVYDTKEELLDEAKDQSLEYLVHQFGRNWEVSLDSGEIDIKLDIVSPGNVYENGFLNSYWLQHHQNEIVFERD